MRWLLVVTCLAGCGRRGFDDVLDGSSAIDAPTTDGDASVDPGIVELAFRGGTPCVRSGEGRVACWGRNGHGQVGAGTISAREAPHVVDVTNVVKVGSGEFVSYAIDRDGALWGWGNNAQGQMGLGSTTPSTYSLPVRVPVPEPVVDVAAGEHHTCAITRGARELYCWGDNDCSQLGNQTTLPEYAPFKVPGLSDVVKVTVSDQETCTIDASNELRCIGAAYSTTAGCQNLHLTPTAPTGVATAMEVVGGCHMSTCAIDGSGRAWCWGEDQGGQLGDGASMDRANPAQVTVLSGVRAISTGFSVSCAVTTTGSVHCWGQNIGGQLGVDDTNLTGTPTPLPLPFFTGQPIDQIETGCSTTCVRSNHDLYCWGDNTNAVIDDTTSDAYKPVRRLGLPF